MNKIILRFYKTPENLIKKYNLICTYRYVYYDYKNNILCFAGIPEHLNKKDFIKSLLQNNKHKFTKKIKNVPLF